MGTYSIIVFAEVKDLARLTNVVVEGIHRTKGVVDTNTAIVVEGKSGRSRRHA
jgi:DNA-binding Lrp family transcriptional regulator